MTGLDIQKRTKKDVALHTNCVCKAIGTTVPSIVLNMNQSRFGITRYGIHCPDKVIDNLAKEL